VLEATSFNPEMNPTGALLSAIQVRSLLHDAKLGGVINAWESLGWAVAGGASSVALLAAAYYLPKLCTNAADKEAEDPLMKDCNEECES